MRKFTLACWLGLALFAFSDATAFIIGIDFPSNPVFNQLAPFSPGSPPNFFPYSFTDPTSPFGQWGALTGVTEEQLQSRFVDAVQDAFRRVSVPQADRMLRVDIRLGRVPKSIGTVHLVGMANQTANFGVARVGAALTRRFVFNQPDYDNAQSLTFADVVGRLPEFSPGLQFDTLDSVIHAIAGTTAHEIAHTLGVENHDPATAVNGFLSIMATTSTGLPFPERLRERQFVEIPNTQSCNSALACSTPDILRRIIPTTTISDFNFDGASNASDVQIWRDHVFETDHTIKRGDANDDRRVDALDFIQWYRDQGQFVGLDPPDTSLQTRLTYDQPTGDVWLELPAGSEFLALSLSGPAPVQDDCTVIASYAQDFAASGYFAGASQWVGCQSPIVAGQRARLGRFDPGLASLDFGAAHIVTRAGSRWSLGVTVIPEPRMPLILLALTFWAIAKRTQTRS